MIYVSAPFEATVSTDEDYRARNQAMSDQFKARVAKQYKLTSPMADCSDFDVLLSSGQPDTSMLDRFDQRLSELTSRPGAIVVPFSPREPGAQFAPSALNPTPLSVGSVTVKGSSALDARRAWDAQVVKALDDDARKRAKAAVKQAQSDAKIKADIERARQERLQRGRAQ